MFRTLRKKSLNTNEWNRTVASVGDVTVSKREFVARYEQELARYNYYGMLNSLTDEDKAQIKENVLDEVATNKLYVARMKELGLSLSEEDIAAAQATAESTMSSIESSITVEGGGKVTDSVVERFYETYFGMTRDEFKSFSTEQEEGDYAFNVMQNYFAPQVDNYSEEELEEFYYTKVGDTYRNNYSAGEYSEYMEYWLEDTYSAPYIYVPEDFIYVYVAEVSNINRTIIDEYEQKLKKGEMTYEQLYESSDNVNYLRYRLEGPYAIGPEDYSYVASCEDLYDEAFGMEIGEWKLVMRTTQVENDEGVGDTIFNGFFVKRAEGSMCRNDQPTGVVKLDRYEGVRDLAMQSFKDYRTYMLVTETMGEIEVDETVYQYESEFGKQS